MGFKSLCHSQLWDILTMRIEFTAVSLCSGQSLQAEPLLDLRTRCDTEGKK